MRVYMLYEGESEDGMGQGTFYRATEDVAVAREFYLGICDNPYSIGHVSVLTENSLTRIGKIYENEWMLI